ncbi:serine hydrolase domain-containing protein [Maribacter sp.]
MTRILIFSTLVLFLTSCNQLRQKKENSKKGKGLEMQTNTVPSHLEWMDNKIDSMLTANDIPGFAIGVIEDGKVSWASGYGEMERKAGVPFSTESICQIASLTKMFTGAVVKELINEGKLRPQEPITKYLDDVLDEDAKEHFNEVTVELVLHHRSGIPNHAPSVNRIDGDPMLIAYTQNDMNKDLNTIELDFKPNEKWAYSNYGYDILGYICEKASGKSYDALIKEYITDKYGLEDTFINLTETKQKLVATPYRKDDRTIKTKPWNMGKEVPSGGIYSNVDDLLRLMSVQIDHYRKYSENPSNSSLILTSNVAETGYDGLRYGYGLFERKNRLDHFGDLDGYGSDYRLTPEYNVGIVCLTSSGGVWLDDLMDDIYLELLESKK